MEPNTSLSSEREGESEQIDKMGFNILLISFKLSCQDLLAQIDTSALNSFVRFFSIVEFDEWGKKSSVLEWGRYSGWAWLCVCAMFLVDIYISNWNLVARAHIHTKKPQKPKQ